jgi:uncharacterized membrane protein YfhO
MVLYLGMLHPFFIIPMVVFPLVLTGIERFIQANRKGVLVFAVFLAAVSNYYFFFSQAILAAAYFFIRLIVHCRAKKLEPLKILKKTGAAVLYVILGTGLAAAILVPVMLQFSANSRLGIEYARTLFMSLSITVCFLQI